MLTFAFEVKRLQLHVKDGYRNCSRLRAAASLPFWVRVLQLRKPCLNFHPHNVRMAICMYIHSERFLVFLIKELNFAGKWKEKLFLKKTKHHSIGKTCGDLTVLERLLLSVLDLNDLRGLWELMNSGLQSRSQQSFSTLVPPKVFIVDAYSYHTIWGLFNWIFAFQIVI